MIPFPAAAAVLFALAWIVAPAVAQHGDDLARGLRPDARADERARAAVAYGDRKATNHTADVVQLLIAASKKRRDDAELCVSLAALDGLIRADARPSAAEARTLAGLASIYAGGLTRLFAADIDRYAPALLALADRERVDDYVLDVVCRLVVRAKTRAGLAAMLLRRLHPRVTVIVRDPDSPALGLGGDSRTSRGHGSIHVPGDFPRFGYWTLTRRSGRSKPIVPGKPKVFAHRRAVEPGARFVVHRLVNREAGDRTRMLTLAVLLGRDLEAIRNVLRRGGSIDYRDEEQCRREIDAIRNAAERGFTELVQELLARDLLTAVEAEGLAPRVDVRIEDQRGDHRRPLPGSTVRIGKIDWWTDYDRALAHAKRVDKPLFLHFGENPG